MWIYLVIPLAVLVALILLWTRVVGVQTIYDYQKGLLYRHGKIAAVLDAGRHFFLKHRSRIDVFDLRSAMLVVPGQSILTKDNVSIKISLSGRHEVVDPKQVATASANYYVELYDICQMTLRDIVATTTIDELLEKKTVIDEQLLTRAAPKIERLGVKLTELAVRDIVLPANLKKAFAAVLEAQKEAQRQLEQARGEQAVLRSLANSSKMYENNPTLLQARLIQALATGNNTIVFNGDGKTVVTPATPKQ